ncbi:MAG: acylase [Cytophagales bacterium]|uniref:penicillin acylase family protein n=1 Tax=Cyclobacterium marinum TaxID=104 RepID=UPI0030D900C6|nr:acylase [Cytophagales bacterium]
MYKKLLLFVVPIFLSLDFPNIKPPTDEILWDKWGIPHIYASTDDNLYYMMGWAQMHNHGNLILKLYGEGRAKSSEYWSEDIGRDKLLHQLGVLNASQKAYALLPQKEKQVLISFAKGINTYAEQNPNELEEKYKVVLPVKPEDILQHTFRVFYLEFLINRNISKANKWTAGSNGWAISGSKTTSGNSMLMANPHLNWDDFWLFFEAHLITETNDLYGTTLVGLPTIGIGFNKNLGWTHTVNTLDNVDLYELTLQNGQYQLDNEFHDFTIDSVQIIEKTGSEKKATTVLRKQSAFGMVYKEEGNKAIAIKWPNTDGKLNIIGQWLAMGESQSLEEFQGALAMNGLPLFNVIYSDKENNILYHFGGNAPKKNGDWKKWQNIVASTSSDDLWQGYYSSEEVPTYLNPESGWIQNANDPPYTSTFPAAIRPDDYPSHMAPNAMGFRPQRSALLIKDAMNLNLDQLIALKHDTKSEYFLRIKEDLRNINSMELDSLTKEALEILLSWNGAFEANSTGPVLFGMLAKELGSKGVFAEEWDFNDPLNTPRKLKDLSHVTSSLQIAAEKHQQIYGSLAVSYGDVYRLEVGNHSYAANGGAGSLGIFRTMNYSPKGKGQFIATHGETYVCATEFGKEVTAKALMSYGNATQAHSPHVGDQLELFSKKQLRKVLLQREDQLQNLEKREQLSQMQ